MPMFTMDANTDWYTPNDVVSVSWFQYQEGDAGFKPYTKASDYPDKTMKFNYFDSTKFGFGQKTGTMFPLSSGSTTFDPTKLLNDIRDKKAANKKYQADYRTYLSKKKDYDAGGGKGTAPVAPTKPVVLKASDYPGYDKFDYSTYKHTVGWGAPSKDVYALSKLSFYAREVYFGVFGQRGIYDKDFVGGVTKNPDPSTGCNAKYIGINFIVWDGAWSQPASSPLKLTARAQKMRDLDFTIPELSGTPTSPTDLLEGKGGTYVATSLAAMGTVLMAATYL